MRIEEEPEESRGGENTKTSAENHEMGRVGLTPNQEKPESLDWSICENNAREAPKTARDKRLRVRICLRHSK